MTNELTEVGIEKIQARMEIQRKSSAFLIHGEKDENTLCTNAINSYTYFQNCFRTAPRKCEIETVEDNKNDLC